MTDEERKSPVQVCFIGGQIAGEMARFHARRMAMLSAGVVSETFTTVLARPAPACRLERAQGAGGAQHLRLRALPGVRRLPCGPWRAPAGTRLSSRENAPRVGEPQARLLAPVGASREPRYPRSVTEPAPPLACPQCSEPMQLATKPIRKRGLKPGPRVERTGDEQRERPPPVRAAEGGRAALASLVSASLVDWEVVRALVVSLSRRSKVFALFRP